MQSIVMKQIFLVYFNVNVWPGDNCNRKLKYITTLPLNKYVLTEITCTGFIK